MRSRFLIGWVSLHQPNLFFPNNLIYFHHYNAMIGGSAIAFYGFKLKLNLISCRTSLQNFNASRAVSLSAEAPG